MEIHYEYHPENLLLPALLAGLRTLSPENFEIIPQDVSTGYKTLIYDSGFKESMKKYMWIWLVEDGNNVFQRLIADERDIKIFLDYCKKKLD